MADERNGSHAVDSAEHGRPERSGLRVPLPGVLMGLGVLAATAPGAQAAARNDAYTVAPGTQLTGVNVLANDAPVPPIAAVAVTSPGAGTAALDGAGNLTYTPPSNVFVGVDTFGYLLADAVSNSVAQVRVGVGAGVAIDDSYGVQRNGTLTGVNVLSNDLSWPNTSVAAFLSSAPSHGSAAIAPDGVLTYTPTPGYVGPDSFNYVRNDGVGNTVATVNIAVTGEAAAVPALAPAALGALSGLLAYFGMRRRKR